MFVIDCQYQVIDILLTQQVEIMESGLIVWLYSMQNNLIKTIAFDNHLLGHVFIRDWFRRFNTRIRLLHLKPSSSENKIFSLAHLFLQNRNFYSK